MAEAIDTTKGDQFAALTFRGQLYYADRIKEGASHEEALADARFSYGVKR